MNSVRFARAPRLVDTNPKQRHRTRLEKLPKPEPKHARRQTDITVRVADVLGNIRE